MVELVTAVELNGAGGGATPAGDGGGDDRAASLVDRDYVSTEDAGYAGGESGNESGLAGRMRPLMAPMFAASAGSG
jgi:hypothetical protein